MPVELCSAGGKEVEIGQALVAGKLGEQLLLELGPAAPGDDGDLDDLEQVVQERGDHVVGRRLARGERAIEVKDDQSLHVRLMPSEP